MSHFSALPEYKSRYDTYRSFKIYGRKVAKSAHAECFGQFGWEQAYGIFNINLAVKC